MKIDLVKNLHQDNLKAEIYFQFKNRFVDSSINILCEYYVLGCRFDMIVYSCKTEDVLCLIEVRKIGAKKEPKLLGKKHLKYSQFGCDILYISQFFMIKDLLDKIENIYSNYKSE
jgi:hypothetical protein